MSKAIHELTFEEALAELEHIVRALEGGGLPLEEPWRFTNGGAPSPIAASNYYRKLRCGFSCSNATNPARSV